MIKLVKKFRLPTAEAHALKTALERRGVRVLAEVDDGHKHIDLAVPHSKINIEVDGIQHLTEPYQILADLNRGYYSHIDGYNTMHIPNEMLQKYLEPIADGLAEACKIRERQICIHLN